MGTLSTQFKQQLDREISLLLKQSGISNSKSYETKRLTYEDFLSNRLLIIKIIRNGIPYSFFSLIQYMAPFSENDWAIILDLSTKSLQRYKKSSRSFRPLQSEKIIEIAEVTNIGLELFGEMNKFKLWLDTPNFALGNHKPIELLRDSYGKEMVIGELTRINHGIFV
ncbi:MAG: DUF2384 domain-containing protein [Bacteroidetes bacterium]|nr:DUF2384 domain-containing protein [Bacteroidota bacterium]